MGPPTSDQWVQATVKAKELAQAEDRAHEPHVEGVGAAPVRVVHQEGVARPDRLEILERAADRASNVPMCGVMSRVPWPTSAVRSQEADRVVVPLGDEPGP
jgi:hypothetical protein